MAVRISQSFKDISLFFVPHPATQDLPALVNERSIVRSIRNLVETIPTERFFNPDFGSDVRDSLFEFVDVGTASIIETQIATTILRYEPRVENTRVSVEPSIDENSFEVTVIFDIKGIDVPPVSFSFILEATR